MKNRKKIKRYCEYINCKSPDKKCPPFRKTPDWRCRFLHKECAKQIEKPLKYISRKCVLHYHFQLFFEENNIEFGDITKMYEEYRASQCRPNPMNPEYENCIVPDCKSRWVHKKNGYCCDHNEEVVWKQYG